LAARVWVVTGGAAGIGQAIGQRAGREGERVVLVDRDEERVIATADAARRAGHDVSHQVVDLRDEEAIAACIEWVVAEQGVIDVLVNNAGLALREGSVAELSRKQWDLTIAVNLTAVYLVCHHAVPRMPPGSAIVNVATAGALRAVPGTDAYIAAKAGVIGLTKAMAVSLADRGIRANAVCPNVILTEEVRARQDDPRVQAMVRRTGEPLGRGHGEPHEVADVVWYLASPQASFLNGLALPVDGGATA
jgi:NAD(P)-dependent dehydrogenase (short-subunit alcohol dehydrogenase family)